MTNRQRTVGLLLVAAASVACSGKGSHSDAFVAHKSLVMSGALRLTYGDVGTTNFIQRDSRCHGDGGFSDIRSGASVTVRDAASHIVAVGRLEPGRIHIRKDGYPDCSFPFTVAVPQRSFYEVEVSHRGSVDYTRADVEAGPLTLHLG